MRGPPTGRKLPSDHKDFKVVSGCFCREWSKNSWQASVEVFLNSVLWDPTESFSFLLSDTAFIPRGVGMGNT